MSAQDIAILCFAGAAVLPGLVMLTAEVIAQLRGRRGRR